MPTLTDSSIGAEPLDCQRTAFSIPEGICYLNSAYMGPLPIAVQSAGHDAVDVRAQPWTISPNDFFAPAERVRALCAGLINAPAEQLALIPNTSWGTAVIAANLEPRPGTNVVILAEQFPSNVHPWRRWRAQGVEIRSVHAPQGPLAGRAARWSEAVISAIDGHTILVSVEQAHWTDGTLFDLEAIGQSARRVGAAYVVDATQTAGAMPIDFSAIGADALIVHSYKAMLCNYGLGFMALSPRFMNGKPLDDNWLLREGSDNFATLTDYADRYAPGARRFDTSLRANPSLIAMLEASCKLLRTWGPARIRSYLLGIVRPQLARLEAAGFVTAPEAERAANIFGIGLPPGLEPEALRRLLAERAIFVSVRSGALRVAPHVYNDEADIARLADALLEALSLTPRRRAMPDRLGI